jgi:predicted nuclease of predicted toxin-antitoxin system
MRFLADENFPAAAVAALRLAGNDVVWIRNAAPGCSDHQVLEWAMRDDRILLTFDKDFGELARATALPATGGVILLRVPVPPSNQVGQQIANAIVARSNWAGHFSVVEPGRIRMRRLGK